MIATQAAKEVNGLNLEVLEETAAAIQQDPQLGKCKFRARNKWMGGTQNCTMLTDFFAARQEQHHQQAFELHADEPPMLAGQDQAPNPVEHLLNALAGCVTTSLVAHAAVRGIPIQEVESELEGDLDMRGFFGISEEVPKGFTHIRMRFRIKCERVSPEQLKRLAEFSPVYNTLTHGVGVDIQIEPKP